MRYRIAFVKRVQSDGDPSDMQPSAELDENLPEGIVVDKAFVEQLESDAQHSQEVLDEDDAFLGSAAPEVWEYEVVDARREEFETAIRESDLILEFDVVDDTVTSADEGPGLALADAGVYPADRGAGDRRDTADATSSGSGHRAGDDGPAGMPTGDPSAGGLGSGSLRATDEEALASGSGGIDDLNVTKAGDRRLGLTNRGEKPAEDWAADTGPARVPDRGLAVENPADDASTLAPDKPRKRAGKTVRR